MSAGDLITQPGQIQFRDLLLGMGTDYNVTKLVGWEDLPPVDNGYKHKPRQHGADPGLLLAQAHAVTATLDIDPLAGGGTAAARSFLRSRTGLGTDATLEPIAVCLDTGDIRIRYGQLKARNIPIGLGYEIAVRDAVLQWECPDPRLYGGTLQTVLARLPVAAPASQVTRTNYQPNPALASGTLTGFASYSAGTGEVGTSSVITGAGDGPLPQITSYARWSVTTAKTGGSTGWIASAFSNRGQLGGNVGDPVADSLYLRYTGTGTTTLVPRITLYNSGGSSVQNIDGAPVTLTSGQWTRVTLTATASVVFASVGWWTYQTSGFTLPAGSTLDATGSLIEGSTVIGDWFSGSTPAVPNQKTYAWLGTANNSASTETTSASGLYPLTYPFSYPQLVAGGGPQQVTNNGNAPTPPVYTITGPVTSPALTINDAAGSRRIVFNLALAVGEQLVIDVLNRTVTLGVGGANRYGFSSGVPIENLYLSPGASTIALDGSGDSTTSLTVTYRDADL